MNYYRNNDQNESKPRYLEPSGTFTFSCKFEEPFFGITPELDMIKAYQKAKSHGFSFYIYYLYLSLKEQTKQRISTIAF